MTIKEWFHHLFNPHCEECQHNAEQMKVCLNCEYLKLELEKSQQLNRELIDKLPIRPESVIPQSLETVPVKPKFIPWHVRRQMLEAEDRVAAQKLKEVQQSIAKNVSAPSGGVQVQIASDDDPDVIALEKELRIVEQEREHASGQR